MAVGRRKYQNLFLKHVQIPIASSFKVKPCQLDVSADNIAKEDFCRAVSSFPPLAQMIPEPRQGSFQCTWHEQPRAALWKGHAVMLAPSAPVGPKARCPQCSSITIKKKNLKWQV